MAPALGGLTAASTLAEGGAHVLVVEKAAAIGGSAGLSGGMVWTAEDPGLVFEGGYGGGLAAAGVFGLRAADGILGVKTGKP